MTTRTERNTRQEDAGQICVVRLLAESSCDRFLAEVDRRNAWQASPPPFGTAGAAGLDKGRWDTDDVLEDDRPDLFRDVRAELIASLAASEQFAASGLVLPSLRLMRYGEGAGSAAHVDSTARRNAHRRYTVVVYLNDDFGDGATSFPGLGKEARGAKGEAVVFPSRYIHAGSRIAFGRKHVIVGFLCDAGETPAQTLVAPFAWDPSGRRA